MNLIYIVEKFIYNVFVKLVFDSSFVIRSLILNNAFLPACYE